MFLNSHLLSEVELVCDRVAIIDHGRVIATGKLEDLLAQGSEVVIEAAGVTAEALSAVGEIGRPVEAADGRIRVQLPNRESIPLVAETLMRHGARIYSLTRRNTLEDLFIRMVEGETRE